MARGLSRFCHTNTFRMDPSRLPTSIRLVPVSVQYTFRPTASTASPSVVCSPAGSQQSSLAPALRQTGSLPSPAGRQAGPRRQPGPPVVTRSSCCEPSRRARLILRSVLSDQYTLPGKGGHGSAQTSSLPVSKGAHTTDSRPETPGHVREPYIPKERKSRGIRK